MHVVLALILIGSCAVLLAVAIWRPGVLRSYCAALALFSIGYYGLPMLMIERSSLRYLPESEISATIGMALLFLAAVLAGLIVMGHWRASAPGLHFRAVDRACENYWWTGAIISNAILIAYNLTTTLTFYQVESVDEFIADRGALDGILGFVSGFAQAFSALYLVTALQSGRKDRIGFAVAAIAIQVAMVSGAGQRLILILPVFLVMAAMVARKSFKLAGATLAAGVAILLVVSPLAVALRAGSWNSTQDIQAENFSYGDDPVDVILQSIIDRGDILQNTATLKAYVDSNGYVGPTYYYSVLVIPVPRFLYPSKPFVLSDTGKMDGEASILAWRLSVGPSIGSLTAFGSIIAYREGGWVWVPINGVLTGLFIAFLLRWFQRGGFVAQGFFVLVFVSWSVRKVPPSLMEVMVNVMTYLPVLIGIYLVNRILEGDGADILPAGTAGRIAET